jgi:competence protein ComEA
VYGRTDDADSVGTPAPAVESATLESPLDLNSASYQSLQSLKGIGPVLAERIIANRPYKDVDDLVRVPGIGPKTLEKLRPFVRVKPSSEP